MMVKDKLPVAPLPASFLRSVTLVAWSFFGIRSSSQYQQDLAKVNPLHVVLVGIAAALLLVVGLITLVHWVVAK
jgi:amino acid transporter